ncbi:hypothetical protein [Phocaeicola vulgatus]|uniref:hypothetical protein n=1 Tax=Phocaeicola vulgatus TaxID=821 RepID=UPI0032C02067
MMETRNKITPVLFCTDIDDKKIENLFKSVFDTSIEELLYDYDEYDEIDAEPIEIGTRGIMIGFLAETSKEPAQIEYIDLDILNHHENLELLSIVLPKVIDKTVEDFVSNFENPKIFYSINDMDNPERVIFYHNGLRYELLLGSNLEICRIRVFVEKDDSTVNMRTYYSFEET